MASRETSSPQSLHKWKALTPTDPLFLHEDGLSSMSWEPGHLSSQYALWCCSNQHQALLEPWRVRWENTERLVLLSDEIILSLMDIFEIVIFGIQPKRIIPSDLKLTLGASPPNSRSFTLRGHGDFGKFKRRFFSHSIFPLLLNFDPGKLFRGTRVKTNRL